MIKCAQDEQLTGTIKENRAIADKILQQETVIYENVWKNEVKIVMDQSEHYTESSIGDEWLSECSEYGVDDIELLEEESLTFDQEPQVWLTAPTVEPVPIKPRTKP